MKDWNIGHYILLIIGILILIYILSPSSRKWTCSTWNKFKKVGDKCSNCDTKASGIITESGECLPVDQVAYEKCTSANASMENGSDCNGCGANPANPSTDAYSGKGIVIGGRCVALPDAFAGKICVPSSAQVNANPLSYKREQVSDNACKYFKVSSNRVSQRETLRDTEISKSEYVNAFVQTMAQCPVGQVKV